MNKKKYFKKKMNDVECMIADLEFKRFKAREIREEVRQEYDACKSRLGNAELQINAQLKDPKKICEVHNPEEGKEALHKTKGTCVCDFIEKAVSRDEFERLQDQKALIKRDMDKLLEQIKQIDLDIHGSGVTNDYPQGVIGAEQQLESLRELIEMIKQYIKTL